MRRRFGGTPGRDRYAVQRPRRWLSRADIRWGPDSGRSQLIMKPEPYHWDEMKIGPGAPPIKTDQGWLSIYHGVFRTMDGSVYRLEIAS